MSYIGTTEIGGMYLGNTEIAKAYLGTDLVFQKGAQPQPVQHTLNVLLSSYDSVDKSYYNITGTANAYLDPDDNTSSPCSVVMARGSERESWCYFKFDTTSLPQDASIVSVSVKARPATSTGNANYIAEAGCVLCSGTTVKTESINTSTSKTLSTFPAAQWTLAELSDVRIKIYGKRGSSNVNNNYYLRMYGAEMTIVYTTPS